ncbi:outer membrane protein transport protein [Planctomycetota bacterium]|nr:outer membrane protein transport protein [Planctomycetota bacterium]
MARRRLGWLLFVGACLAPAVAHADNFEEFGFGARAQGMGGAQTAVADDGSATYYNPGGLVLSKDLKLTFGLSFADYQLKFDSQRGGALDDAAERISDLSAFTLGISATIPIDIPDRLAIGIGLFLPTRGIIKIDAKAVTNEPEFFRYGSRHDRIHILASLAVKVTDWLSFGAGASVLTDAAGGTTLSAGLATPVDPSFKIGLEPDAGAVVGVRLAPTEWLAFGLTYRSEVSLELEFDAVANLQGINVPLNLQSISFFSPHQIQFGAAFYASEALLLTFDFSWVNWSAYDDPFLRVETGVPTATAQQDFDLDDVVSPKLGVEFMAMDWLALRGGYWFRNSAVPDQDNELTNLADGSKHVLTLGVGMKFGQSPPPAETDGEAEESAEGGEAQTFGQAVDRAKVDVDLFFQYHFHPEVSVTRPATDAIGSWDAGGSIVNFGIQITAKF